LRAEAAARPAEAAARITEAVIAAGHDGRAELVIEVTYANGARARVRLDEEAAEPVLAAAGIARIEDLVGRPWDILTAARPVPAR
jgi:hypothetical protein